MGKKAEKTIKKQLFKAGVKTFDNLDVVIDKLKALGFKCSFKNLKYFIDRIKQYKHPK